MNDRTTQSGFPVMKAAVVIVLAAALLTPVAWFAATLVSDRGAMDAAMFALVVVGGMALLSLIPVAIVGRRGVMPTVTAWFAATLVRLPGCLILAAVAVRSEWLPGPAMVAALGVFYVPLLLIEAGFVGRYLWRKDDQQDDLPKVAEVTA
jgi:hypothetical protein